MSKYIDDHIRLQGRSFNTWARRAQIVVFPALFIALFVLAPGWSASRRLDWPMGLPASASTWPGILLGGSGFAMYLWTIVLFARVWGTQVPVAPTQRLVTAGPYAVSRNPMVTSAILMVCGLGVFRDSWSFMLAGLVMPSVYLVYLALVEEKELEARFGAEYVAYRNRTPFLVPKVGRVHAFELEDQPWFPAIVRDAGMAFLRFAADRARHAERIRPVIESALVRTGEREILDLCSGGGGPIVTIARAMRADGHDVRLTMTDLYPSEGARSRVGSDGETDVSYETSSIDATAVPRARPGLRTIFNAFHHFRPHLATRILASAVDSGRPIAVIEVAQRRVLTMLGMLCLPVVVLLSVPFLRPFRLAWLPLTYVIPVIPLFIWWDGTISMMRVYNADELLAMAQAADPDDRFEWHTRELRLPPSPFPGIALVGTPRSLDAN